LAPCQKLQTSFKAYGRDAREIGKLREMGALRLGKLALLAVLGLFAGRMQLRAHP